MALLQSEDESDTTVLFSTLGASFGACICLVFIWRFLIAPAIPAYKKTGEDDRVYLASSFVSLYPAMTAPFLAIAAAASIPVDDDAVVMAVAPTRVALHAVGISCGYMLYDTFYCLIHRQVRSPLVIGHHVLSVLIWPYAVLQHRGLLMILFFVMTEITNIGQHVRMMLLKLGCEQTRTYTVNGVLWVVAFFVVRILPSPFMVYKMVYGSYAAYSTFDFGLAVATTPLPFVLNSYWFYLLFNGVIKFLSSKRAGPSKLE